MIKLDFVQAPDPLESSQGCETAAATSVSDFNPASNSIQYTVQHDTIEPDSIQQAVWGGIR